MKFRDEGVAAVKIGSTKKDELELVLRTVQSLHYEFVAQNIS